MGCTDKQGFRRSHKKQVFVFTSYIRIASRRSSVSFVKHKTNLFLHGLNWSLTNPRYCLWTENYNRYSNPDTGKGDEDNIC
jgi:hypothetical protein